MIGLGVISMAITAVAVALPLFLPLCCCPRLRLACRELAADTDCFFRNGVSPVESPLPSSDLSPSASAQLAVLRKTEDLADLDGEVPLAVIEWAASKE